MPQIIGTLEGDRLHALRQWVARQPLTELLHSSYARGRLECYYGLAVDLRKEPEITRAIADPFVQSLGDDLWELGRFVLQQVNQFLPEQWHSALLCQYNPGVCINPHRDHGCFSAWAVMVNLGEANFFEYNRKDKGVTPLHEGAIVLLNTKVLHGVLPVESLRYSLTFRNIKSAGLFHSQISTDSDDPAVESHPAII